MNREWLQQALTIEKNWDQCVTLVTSFQSLIDLDKLDQVFVTGNTLFKDDRTTSVAKLETSKQALMVKRYNARSFWHRIKRALRRSRAHRCWHMSYCFRRAGLNVAQPIMQYEKRFGPIHTTAYFLSEFLPGEELLTLLPRMSDEQQQEVVSAIKSAFLKMHKHRLSHGDMKASNLMWVQGELFFIDLDAAQQHFTSKCWLVSHYKDKKRFLKNWQSQPQLAKLFIDL